MSVSAVASSRGRSGGWLVRLGSKGRITLPLELRQRIGIKEGDTAIITSDAKGIHVELRSQNMTDEESREGYAASPSKRSE